MHRKIQLQALDDVTMPEMKKFFAIYFAIVPQCYTVKNTVKERKYSYKHLNNVTMSEIKKFFAIYFAIGIVPQCKLRDYWQAKNVITQTPAFHQVMYKNHWCAIWTLCLPEFKKFFAIYFAMGIVPQCNLRDYWQAKNVITQIPAFLQVISKNYLCAIWTHLHFSYNTKAVPGGAYGYDRLFKIRQLIDTAVPKFCTHYQAAKELSIDEMKW